MTDQPGPDSPPDDIAEAADSAAESAADLDVEGAEQEAADAAAFAAALEAKYVEGGELAPGELEQAEGLSRWARLKVQRTRLAAARAAEAARLSASRELAAEAAAYGTDAGQRIAAALAATAAADDAFRALVEEHNATIRGWKARAAALDVPVTRGYALDSDDDHGGIRQGRNGSTECLQAGERIYSIVSGESLLDAFREHPADRERILAQVSTSGTEASR